MSKLFTELSKRLFHYFNSWQLTIAFIFLLMQLLMLLGIFASGYAGSPYINYWVLLGYGWFNTVYVWMTLSIYSKLADFLGVSVESLIGRICTEFILLVLSDQHTPFPP
jgi:apolipoprotein N-acyltransferase